MRAINAESKQVKDLISDELNESVDLIDVHFEIDIYTNI